MTGPMPIRGRLVLALALALVASLGGCESTDDNDNVDPSSLSEAGRESRDGAKDGAKNGARDETRARGVSPDLSKEKAPAAVTDVKPAREEAPRPGEPPAAEVWDLSPFAPTTDAEVKVERTLFEALRESWRRGDFAAAHRRLTAAIRAHPARLELYLLRAATVLGAFDAARTPLNALGGRAPPKTLPLRAVLAMITDLERAFPARPPLAVPWSGLYHPYALAPLTGETVQLWARGVGPLFQLRALAAGRIDLFGELETDDFSLVDLILKAQLAATQGDGGGASHSLTADLSARVGEEAWRVWRPRLAALAIVCGSLAEMKNDDIAYAALNAWGEAAREAIPQVGDAVLVLPRPAFDAARAVAKGKNLAAVLGAPPEIPDAGAIVKLMEAFSKRSNDVKNPATAELEVEVLDALFGAALRWRDFRADCLRRFQKGDAGGIFSPGAVRDGGDRDGGARRGTMFLKVEGVGVAFLRKGVKSPEGANLEQIPVSGGSAVWILTSGQ